MILVDLTHAFPISVGDTFAYITDTGNWKTFSPNFVRHHDRTQAKWDTPVDEVPVVIRLPSRDAQVSVMLEKYEPDSRVPCVSRQKGLPDAKHERYFKAVPEGFAFRPVVVFEPRSGPAGLVDRLFVRRAVPGASASGRQLPTRRCGGLRCHAGPVEAVALARLPTISTFVNGETSWSPGNVTLNRVTIGLARCAAA
jgi:hypothetical protein